MQKISDSTNTANAAGEFTEGNAAGGIPATLLRADWLNAVQRELVALATLGGGSLDSNKSTQAKDAILAAIAQLAPLASPALTGTPTAPTAAVGTSTTQIATTAFVAAVQTLLNTAIAQRAPLASPALTGTPTAPTAAVGTSTTQIATTAFVAAVQTLLNTAIAQRAPLASPALTGTPTAPTAAAGTNTTQIATTAYVRAALAALVDSSPAALDTLYELAAAIGNDPNFATTVTNALAAKAPLASPKFTGTPETSGTMHIAKGGGGLELGRTDGTSQATYIDFHSGAEATDYDARIISTGGNGALGGATLAIQCAALVLPTETRAPTTPLEVSDTRLATTAFVHNLIGAGAIQLFARNTAPAGWLKANGAAVSRTAYAGLFAAIGTTYGAGDGSTTFNLPDLRGEFMRGWDDGRGVDIGRSFGSVQGSAFAEHSHRSAVNVPSSPDITDFVARPGLGPVAMPDNASTDNGFARYIGTETNTGGTETRPRNIALLACIKF
jgi:phage-related tail fiber protein